MSGSAITAAGSTSRKRAAAGSSSVRRTSAVGAFSFEDVAERAQLQARQPYRDTSRKAPAQLQALTYDQYRDIRFRPERALWRRVIEPA